ncbi:glycosyltransferase family 4 protein [Ensifer adhaerens]|uniref:glycosyltransferase family 4 protein n=1 Tax=Ensifer adhaerens TaxID=106592 RepID=UPI003CFC3F1C
MIPLMRLFFDVTRTLVHSRKHTPTGIDRVEHAYIRYLLRQSDQSDVWFIANTPFGRGAMPPSEMREIFEKIELRQVATAELGASSMFGELVEVLARPVALTRIAPLALRGIASREKDSKATVARAFLRGARRFDRLFRDSKRTVYLHTSHLQLDDPRCFRWLSRPHLFPVFFVHDLIPIEFPEFCSPGSQRRHIARIETVLQYAQAVIVNSEFTRNSLNTYATTSRVPPLKVVPLANTIRDFKQAQESEFVPSGPFFLHVGTIEGRKNIGHLINVWRHIVTKMGAENAPRLVIVGRRGWECENVTSVLDRSRELANHLIEVSNINDLELRSLMLRANGLISVSMTEGYGLPPVEALSLGLPVIASDIPAHREILGDACEYVSLHDGDALARKIIESCVGMRLRSRRVGLPLFDWDQHVERALAFVQSTLEKS